MASVKLRTSDALIRQLSQISGEGADEAAKRAIYVGAGYMAERIKESLRGVVSENATGDLEKSLGKLPESLPAAGSVGVVLDVVLPHILVQLGQIVGIEDFFIEV